MQDLKLDVHNLEDKKEPVTVSIRLKLKMF